MIQLYEKSDLVCSMYICARGWLARHYIWRICKALVASIDIFFTAHYFNISLLQIFQAAKMWSMKQPHSQIEILYIVIRVQINYCHWKLSVPCLLQLQSTEQDLCCTNNSGKHAHVIQLRYSVLLINFKILLLSPDCYRNQDVANNPPISSNHLTFIIIVFVFFFL